MADISTGGGSYVEGSASAGNDYIGRDSVIYNYNIDQLDTDQLVKIMARRLLGSELHNVKGIVTEIKEINQEVKAIANEQRYSQLDRDSLNNKVQRNYEIAEARFLKTEARLSLLFQLMIWIVLIVIGLVIINAVLVFQHWNIGL